ncbi:MAG: hypothetical protein WDW36_004441 [Sanguina aurantia]
MLQVVGRYLSKAKSQELLCRNALLILIYVLAFSIRLFSVLRYESVIHEFDPYFNYRSTIKLRAGTRWVEWWGGTVYPGLMYTAAALFRISTFLTAHIKLRDVCVFTAPFFAGNTAMVAYLFGKQLKDEGTGIVAAALMAIVPGYISRSVAGSYDNEAVAIFALLTCFYLWVRAVNLGTVSSGVAAAFGYLYMAASWGAYVFISNLIPLYVIVMVCCGRYSRRLFVAYTTFWLVGSLLAQQIRFIGFNHVTSGELLSFNAIFVALQAWEFVTFVRSKMSRKNFDDLLRLLAGAILTAVAGLVVLLVVVGTLSPWTGRFLTLLDPTYAKKFIPIVASVSEHQPTTWASYLFDLHILVFAAPGGLYFCFKHLTDGNVFLITFAMTSIYFSGIMVRLMLVAAPAFVLLSAIAISTLMNMYCKDFREGLAAAPHPEVSPAEAKSVAAAAAVAANAASRRKGASKRSSSSTNEPLPLVWETSVIVLTLLAMGLASYSWHCRWVTSEAYSSPSIVLISGSGPNRVVLDDFREAYYWLRHNTKPDAKVMSWWDYGYQITAMANRTIIVDNNTWNNTHIATVGRAMSSNETEAFKIMRQLDVDYVLVIFGGLSGYSSDDINKFLWMVRISGGVFPEHIKESDYLAKGDYTIGPRATPTMLSSIMYKMCFWEFGNIMTENNKPTGFDRVRQTEIGSKDYTLDHMHEAFTSEHWIVRIFKVNDPENRWG